MKHIRAFKVELNPNNRQMTLLRQHSGAARFVYNWGLNYKIEQRKRGEKTSSGYDLNLALRNRMGNDLAWLSEIPAHCRLGALQNLDRAYSNFFARCKKGKKGKSAGFPKFKSKKKGVGGFSVYVYQFKHDMVRISKIGWVRLKESGYVPHGKYGKSANGMRFHSAKVSERAGRWYISVRIELDLQNAKIKDEKVIGVDFGIKTLAVTSDGLEFQNLKALKSRERKLKRLSRQFSRKQIGSNNRKKAARKLAVHHAKVADLRKHTLHHVSHVLTRKSSVLAIEDLNVTGMMRNHNLAQAVADVGFGELRRQIEYKSKWRGVEVLVADRFFASSKTCNKCGVINADLKLSQRVWTCCCGEKLDRDLNAAINLRNLAASRAVSAYGGESSGLLATAGETGPGEAGSGLEVSVSISPTTSENGSIKI